MAKFSREDYLAEVKAGLSQKEMAAKHACSEALVSKVKRRCEGEVAAATPPVIQAEVLTRQHDALTRLSLLAERCASLAELCEQALNGEGEAAWRARGKMERLVGRKGNVGQAYVAILAEMRKQLELDNTIKRTKFDVEVSMQFMREIMGAINEESPELAQRILRRVQAVHATVSALDFGLSQGDL